MVKRKRKEGARVFSEIRQRVVTGGEARKRGRRVFSRKRKRVVVNDAAPRKRVFSKIRRLGRCIVERSRDTLLGHDPDNYMWSRPCPSRVRLKIGDTVDIFPLLGDFLVSNRRNSYSNSNRLRPHREVMVRADDIRGKTVLVYMISMKVYLIRGGLSRCTHSLVTTLKERGFDFDFEFEVVFVPVDRGPDYFQNCATNRFNDFFGRIPCLAVPFANKRACDLIQDTFFPLPWLNSDPCWALVDPSGKVLLTSDYVPFHIFNDYGIGELVPRIHKMLPSLVDAQGNSKDFAPTKSTLLKLLGNDDEAFEQGIINFNKLLPAPFPDFLLTNDGNKVSVSILEGKVVGLYLCNHAATGRSRIESVKKIYNKIVRLGYDFEIVQIDFNYSGYFRGNVSCPENVPWLTLPYMPSCCKRLIRVFKRCNDFDCHLMGFSPRERDRLVIINPHESNVWRDCFFEQHGKDIICRFGVEAYPFTRRAVYDMLTRRRREEIKLRLIFGQGPLLRRRGDGGGPYDQVPVSQLWGKRVLLIFAIHSKYKPCKFMTDLKSKYLEQKGVDGFEVVYISLDTNASTFDDFTAYMPWLVHPYSWEFARKWVVKTCTYYGDKDDGESYNGSESDSDSDDEEGAWSGAWCGMLSFGEDGEYISRKEFYGCCFLQRTEYPFFLPDPMEGHFDMLLRNTYGINLSMQ